MPLTEISRRTVRAGPTACCCGCASRPCDPNPCRAAPWPYLTAEVWPGPYAYVVGNGVKDQCHNLAQFQRCGYHAMPAAWETWPAAVAADRGPAVTLARPGGAGDWVGQTALSNMAFADVAANPSGAPLVSSARYHVRIGCREWANKQIPARRSTYLGIYATYTRAWDRDAGQWPTDGNGQPVAQTARGLVRSGAGSSAGTYRITQAVTYHNLGQQNFPLDYWTGPHLGYAACEPIGTTNNICSVCTDLCPGHPLVRCHPRGVPGTNTNWTWVWGSSSPGAGPYSQVGANLEMLFDDLGPAGVTLADFAGGGDVDCFQDARQFLVTHAAGPGGGGFAARAGPGDGAGGVTGVPGTVDPAREPDPAWAGPANDTLGPEPTTCEKRVWACVPGFPAGPGTAAKDSSCRSYAYRSIDVGRRYYPTKAACDLDRDFRYDCGTHGTVKAANGYLAPEGVGGVAAAAGAAAAGAAAPRSWCRFLGPRVEYRAGCDSGWMCSHKCDSARREDQELHLRVVAHLGPAEESDPRCVPGEPLDCQTCPGHVPRPGG